MPKVNLYNINGETIGDIELDDNVFGVEVNQAVLHQVVTAQLANKRQGTQSTLTRAEVRGGGIKPWRQKGSGRARQGSTRSPQWRHGGVVFAPKPRDYHKDVNKKVKRLAIKCALSAKVQSGEIIVVDDLNLSAPKTREMAKVLLKLEANKKALVVIDGQDETLKRASGNLQNVLLASVHTINVLDILRYDSFIVTRDAVEKIQEVYA